ncbi:hypothetical protein VTJ04DRAFT_9436 [Mycothermus thermophilus]|uniref:uncharacterized protein n=1 Tax=Humicola insolens TaxID=85995 RepID=UPI00374252DC
MVNMVISQPKNREAVCITRPSDQVHIQNHAVEEAQNCPPEIKGIFSQQERPNNHPLQPSNQRTKHSRY